MKAIVLAAPKSGSGKTTVTAAIMRSFARAGKRVAPFKVGPDYIDPKFHSFVAGVPSRNLDSWMLPRETVRHLFMENARGADIAIVEGVMGLFDGRGSGTEGSTAEVAGIIGAPVVLVVDAKGMAASIAPLVNGFATFPSSASLCGVILNNVSGESAYGVLRSAIERYTGVACLGYLPADGRIGLTSRHLGLVPVEELATLGEKLDLAADLAEKHLDLARLCELAEVEGYEAPGPQAIASLAGMGAGLRIAVARDKAFSFYYQDNLDLMARCGVTLVPFSPLADRSLPEDIDGLYLGGGFPEVFAAELAANRPLRDRIRERLLDGLPAYAECGGLLYLCRDLVDAGGRLHEMTGFFDCVARMTGALRRFGYVEVAYDGITVRGHEFHHSELADWRDPGTSFRYRVTRGASGASWECGPSKHRVLAGYPHIHFYANPEFFRKLLARYRGER